MIYNLLHIKTIQQEDQQIQRPMWTTWIFLHGCITGDIWKYDRQPASTDPTTCPESCWTFQHSLFNPLPILVQAHIDDCPTRECQVLDGSKCPHVWIRLSWRRLCYASYSPHPHRGGVDICVYVSVNLYLLYYLSVIIDSVLSSVCCHAAICYCTCSTYCSLLL